MIAKQIKINDFKKTLMSVHTFNFELKERKFHILTAFKLYQVEMYLAQKATEKKTFIKDEVSMEIGFVEFVEDYQTQKSLSVLFETVAVFEPNLYNKIKSIEVTEAVSEVIEYLTGESVKAKEMGVKPSAKSDAENAIQAKDLVDKTKIIGARTIPKAIKKKK